MDSNVIISKQIKPINFNLNEITNKFKYIKNRYNLHDDDMILTLIIFESITKAILSEGNFQNSNLKFENIDIESVLDIKCNIGGKKTRKKKRKKRKKGGNKQLFSILLILLIMLPIVKSGFSGTPTDINTWTNITQQVLGIGEYALTSTETMSYTFNDLGELSGRRPGYCSSISFITSGLISIDDYAKSVKILANWVQTGYVNYLNNYHVGSEVAFSNAVDINLDVTEFTVKKMFLNDGLNAIQDNMVRDRQYGIQKGLFNDTHWSSSALSIPGHYLSATITPNGAMFIKNADVATLSASKSQPDKISGGFYVLYRPPINGHTLDSMKEWDTINDSLEGGLQSGGENYHDTFHDYIIKNIFPTIRKKQFIHFKLVGVIGSQYKNYQSWDYLFDKTGYGEHSAGFYNNMKKIKRLNNLKLNKGITLTSKNKIKHGDKVFIERYTVENPKTKKTPDHFYEDMTNVKKHAQVTQKIKNRNKSLSRNKNQIKRFDRTIKAYQKMRRRGKGRNGGYKNKKTRRKN